MNNQKSLYFMMYHDDNKNAGIMQDLYMMT